MDIRGDCRTSERWSILARATRYGEPEQTYGSKVGVDLDIEFDVTERFALALVPAIHYHFAPFKGRVAQR